MRNTLSFILALLFAFIALICNISLYANSDKPVHFKENNYSWEMSLFIEKAKVFAQETSYDDPNLLFNYIQDILFDSQFQEDPENFMKAWQKRRGYTREFRMPEDPAMGFFYTEVLPYINLEIIIDCKELTEKAAMFVENLDYPQETFSYILGVIENPLFQHHPRLFIKKWKEERGLTLEFRYVEDSARMFFEHELIL